MFLHRIAPHLGPLVEPPAHTMTPRSLEFARTLVRMHTVSGHSNLALIDFVQQHLHHLGVASRITRSSCGTRANLFATLGEGKPAGVVLSGHTDTVPWDGQEWVHDPLGAVVQDGRLYGRGAADMKGFIASALVHAEDFLNSPMPYAVHLALSFDEETGCIGVRELIADLRDAGIRPLACVVGEPTGMVPATAHKGVYRWCCKVRGKEAHSSLTPQSVNAVEMAARLVVRLRDLAEDWQRSEPHSGFDVPFSTASVGQFHGGIADNVVPRDAEFRYEIRNLPGTDAQAAQAQLLAYARALEPAMQAVLPAAGFSFEPICAVPAFQGDPQAAVTRLAQKLSGSAQTTLVAFGTEAGLFQAAGIPSVVCGPGDIQQAHQPDEFITLEQLQRCDAFMQQLAGASAAQLQALMPTAGLPSSAVTAAAAVPTP